MIEEVASAPSHAQISDRVAIDGVAFQVSVVVELLFLHQPCLALSIAVRMLPVRLFRLQRLLLASLLLSN